jgi:hypothetical protein
MHYEKGKSTDETVLIPLGIIDQITTERKFQIKGKRNKGEISGHTLAGS